MWSGATDAVKAALVAKTIDTSIRINVGDETIPANGIIDFSYTHSFSNDDTLIMGGGVTSAQIQVSLVNNAIYIPTVLRNIPLKPYVGIKVEGATSYTWIPIGVFYLDDTTYQEQEDRVQFTAYDLLYFGGDEEITPDDLKTTFPTYSKTLRINSTLMDLIASKIGCEHRVTNSKLRCRAAVSAAGATLAYDADILWQDIDTDDSDEEKVITVRQLLSYIGQIEGGFFRMDRTGRLIIDRIYTGKADAEGRTDLIEASVFTFTPSTYHSFILAGMGEKTRVKKLTGRATNKNGKIRTISRKASGTGRTIIFENPLLYANDMSKGKGSIATPIMNYLQDYFLPITYYPYTLNALGFPIVDVGDKITVKDLNNKSKEVFVIYHNFSYADGGITSEMGARPIQKSGNVGTVASAQVAASSAGAAITTLSQEVGTLSANVVKTDTLKAEIIKAGAITTDTLKAKSIEAGFIHTDNLQAEAAKVGLLTADNIQSAIIEAGAITTKNLAAENAKLQVITAETLTSAAVTAGLVTTQELNVAKAQIEEAVIGTVDATHVRTDELDAKVANTESLKAVNGSIDNLKANYADIATLVTGGATITQASTIQLKAANTVIEDALITSAMIKEIDAAKIKSGTIQTNQVELKSEDGNFIIKDNTIQIKDDTGQVRFQAGLFMNDETGEADIYNLAIYAADGSVLFDATGLGQNTIRDIHIDDSANISAGKLNINSLFTAINDSDNGEEDEYTLHSNKIYLDNQHNTLDLAFQSLSSELNSAKSQMTINATGIEAAMEATNENSQKMAQLSSNVDGISASYQQLQQNVNGLQEWTSSYFKEKADGTFEIGKNSGSATDYAKMRLDTNRVEFINANDEVTAYFGNDGFVTTKGILTEANLIIGNFAFIPRKNGSLDFKKVK